MGTGMMIDGIAASEAIDSSGEVLDVEGCDISELVEGRGVLNWEHRGEDAAGASANDIVGEIVFAKKIFKASDCENDRQRKYWDAVKLPFIYIVSELFDGDGDHEGAKSLAAIIRHYKTRDKSILVRYSIEGSTLDKQGNRLKSCIARRVACTVKPCNRSCHSDVLSDPNGPGGAVDYDKKDFLDFGDDAKKSEHPHPMFEKLGGSYGFEGDPEMPLDKAIFAGSTAGAAPGALVGGAALQREHISGRKMKGAALAAIRDFSGDFTKDKFKAFAKTRMPEASDSFIDHFADLAEDIHIRRKLTKKEEAPAAATPPPAAPAKLPPHIQEIADAEAAPPKPGRPVGEKPFQATIRGQAITANPTVKKPTFDENKGILHTEFGSFPLHLPPAEHFNKILSDPKVEEVHNQAMKGWVKAHKLLKEGRVPPEVVAHAALFAQLSPNTPVPMQEMMYSHLVDSMRATGADPTKPGFADKTKDDWMSRDQPKGYPEHSREFFTEHPGVHLQNASKLTGRQPGDLGGFMLANDKMKNMDRYHTVHQPLVDLINSNGRDVRKTATELMNHKHLGQLWEAKRQTAISSGKPDIGPYQGPAVSGLAPKTSRYMLGMVGGGNVFVPDTHMVRHLTGLEQRADPKTIPLLKNLFWNELNTPVLEGIDRWYAKNHPAVQHMLNHPTWGKHFETPEDAVFPAFWKHWIGIAPDERSRGMFNNNHTEGTTHAPFWDAINPFLDAQKSEIDESLPERTAKIHAQYVKDYGEVPASMLFHAHLLPHLLDAAEQRTKRAAGLSFMAKAIRTDQLDIALRKAVADFESHPTLLQPEMPTVHAVQMKVGDAHQPAGRYAIVGGNLHHLEDYHGILSRFLPAGPVNEQTISRIHGLKMSPHLRITPVDISAPPSDSDLAPPTLPTARTRPPRESVFHYTRTGHDRPHVLEVQNGHFLLDGKKLSYPEAQTIHANIASGAATIRYRKSEAAERIRKMEALLIDWDTVLSKAEGAPKMDPFEVLKHMRAAEAAGHLPPGTAQAATHHLLVDPMTGLGNQASAENFKAQKKPGVYAMIDGTDFSSVNNTFGHGVGNQAIKAYGGALRAALDEAAPGVGKAFRAGGDEMMVHLPSHEHAARFARALHQHLDKVPAIQGTHKLSAGIGLGLSPEHADKALYAAKEQKYLPGQAHIDARQRKRAFPVGQAPNMAHSLVPGFEGPIKLHDQNAAAIHAVSKLPEPPATPATEPTSAAAPKQTPHAA